MEALRTPDERFAGLPGWPWQPRYTEHAGLRVHFIDEGPSAGSTPAPATVLCLHGNPSWSYLYRHMIPVFLGAGLRVVAPDLLGFGRSDKPADEAAHSFAFHRDMLLSFIEKLDLQNVMLVCQDWGGIFGLTLPMASPQRFTRLLVMNTTLATGSLTEGFRQWRDYSNSQPDLALGKLFQRGKRGLPAAEAAAYDAPFPDVRYKAAVRAFPRLVPDGADAPGADISREAETFWRDRWAGESFMAIGLADPVLGALVMHPLQQLIRGSPPPLELPEGGHFLQEWGGPIASQALAHFKLS
jgi:haloalkane dehalogenase